MEKIELKKHKNPYFAGIDENPELEAHKIIKEFDNWDGSCPLDLEALCSFLDLKTLAHTPQLAAGISKWPTQRVGDKMSGWK